MHEARYAVLPEEQVHSGISREVPRLLRSAPVTEALLKVEKFTGRYLGALLWSGAHSKVLKAHGLDVYSSELRIDLGYGERGVDFLDTVRGCDSVITNPPYLNNRNLYFAAHALYVARKKVALLLPLHFLETKADVS